MNDIELGQALGAVHATRAYHRHLKKTVKKRETYKNEKDSSYKNYSSTKDGDFNFHSRFQRDGGDLFDNLTGRMQIDQTLVNAHLEMVKCFCTFTTWGFTSGVGQNLGG